MSQQEETIWEVETETLEKHTWKVHTRYGNRERVIADAETEQQFKQEIRSKDWFEICEVPFEEGEHNYTLMGQLRPESIDRLEYGGKEKVLRLGNET